MILKMRIKQLKDVGLELMFLTPEKCSHDDGITAVELSRHLDMPLVLRKKKLKILFEKCCSSQGINPKNMEVNDIIFKECLKMTKCICSCAALMMLILTNIFLIDLKIRLKLLLFLQKLLQYCCLH